MQSQKAHQVSTCRCQTDYPLPPKEDFETYPAYLRGLLSSFSQLREECEALRRVLIPDGAWSPFRQFIQGPLDEAHHMPVLYLAYKRSCLARLTLPVHRFALAEGKVRDNISPQYRRDLQEDWMRGKDELSRHRKSRSFQGRLAELQMADWLEQQSWEVTDLEMWGGDYDITATDSGGKDTFFEVKFFGTTDEIFEGSVEALQKGSSVQVLSPYDACNYLVFRAGEAAHQLNKAIGNRVVVLVLDQRVFSTSYQFPLQNGWIEWRDPQFSNGSSDWSSFLRGRNISGKKLIQLKESVTRVDQVWLVLRNQHFDLEMLETVSVRQEKRAQAN